MRKILSLLIAVVLGVSTAFATTVYCKMTHSWWNADGAAVAVHYWGGADETKWPGVRMTPVSGEEGTWSCDVPADAAGLVFVRVNGTGAIDYWNAQTADLSLPTDDKDLYTITSASAVWSNQGVVTGEWSKYVASEPVTPTLENGFYLIGKINGVEGWTAADLSADRKFAANPENPAEFVVSTTLAVGDEIKVVNVVNDAITAWYPADGNYVVDAAHAGENKDIYFQETYKAEWAAFGGYFWMGANEEPQVEKYCEKPAGHQKDPNYADANGRVLLTIQKIADSNNIRVAIKNNAAAGNTKPGLNFLWVNAEGATGGVVRYGDGTHAEADVEEVSVIVPFAEARESYNFINIHWAYSGWEGEWAIDGLTVTAAELCEGAAPEPPVEPTLANGFYLIGQNGWDVAALSADLLFAANPETEGEYKLTTTLAEGQTIKVVKVENDAIVAWYPDGMGTEYTVDAAHAGEKDIYFQETYKAEWAAFGGYFWMGSNESTAISNTAADAPAVKVLRNGQFLIKKGDKTYNVMGVIVR